METINRDYIKYPYEFEFGAAESSKTVDIKPELGIRGEVVKIIVEIPDFTNSVTAVVSLINSDDNEVFASSSLAKNNDYSITLALEECVIVGESGEKWKVQLSGVPGGSGGTVALTVYAKG